MNSEFSAERPLRLWPGVIIVAAQWIARFGIPIVAPDQTMYAVMGGVLGFVGIVLWWVFFSRAVRFDRIAAIVVMIAAIYPFLDMSLATGAMGMLFLIMVVPGISLAFVIWAVVSRPWTTGMQRMTMAVAIVVSCLVWTLVRTGGFTGAFDHDLAWRW